MEEFFGSGGGGLESKFWRLGVVLAEVLQTQPDNVQVFSVSDANRRAERELSVWFAARGSPYYRSEKLQGYVAANRAKVTRLFFLFFFLLCYINYPV